MRWIFILLPWLELFSLIQLGSEIGALNALLYVFVTLMLGMALIRRQGVEVFATLRRAEAEQFVPQRLLASELAVGLGGLLLVVPGLITDSLALIVVAGALVHRFRAGSHPDYVDPRYKESPGETLDGEFRRLEE